MHCISSTTRTRLLIFAGILLLAAGDSNARKQFLWEEFEWAHMRELPIMLADYKRVKDFDVVYQQEHTYSEDVHYPDTYIIGMYQTSGSRFERVHLLSRVNPFKEYALVKAVSDYYQTDTTYLDVLVRNRHNKLESVVYRKAKYINADSPETEYVMWKKEKIVLHENSFTTKLIEQWNKQMFE